MLWILLTNWFSHLIDCLARIFWLNLACIFYWSFFLVLLLKLLITIVLLLNGLLFILLFELFSIFFFYLFFFLSRCAFFNLTFFFVWRLQQFVDLCLIHDSNFIIIKGHGNTWSNCCEWTWEIGQVVKTLNSRFSRPWFESRISLLFLIIFNGIKLIIIIKKEYIIPIKLRLGKDFESFYLLSGILIILAAVFLSSCRIF